MHVLISIALASTGLSANFVIPSGSNETSETNTIGNCIPFSSTDLYANLGFPVGSVIIPNHTC